jgi:hypothetical protein
MSCRLIVIAVCLSSLVGCALVTPFGARGDPPIDGGVDAADGAVEGGLDGGLDGDIDRADADTTPGAGGPVTFVSREAELVSDRFHDLDGDGDLDNAVADLGADGIPFMMVVNVMFDTGLEQGLTRWLVHAPFVADAVNLDDPSASVAFLHGADVDDPPDAADDYSGSEAFFAIASALDACGEPRTAFRDVEIRGGVARLEGRDLVLPFLAALPLSQYVAESERIPGSTDLRLVVSGVIRTADLGDLPAPRDWLDTDQTMLEIFLAGGATVGVDVPGLTPDLDLDGDGLETFELDEDGDGSGDGQIVSCIDGDRTVVEGRDCWRDPRFADAFAMANVWTFARAEFAGRAPGWRTRVDGECTEPPEQRFFPEP